MLTNPLPLCKKMLTTVPRFVEEGLDLLDELRDLARRDNKRKVGERREGGTTHARPLPLQTQKSSSFTGAPPPLTGELSSSSPTYGGREMVCFRDEDEDHQNDSDEDPHEGRRAERSKGTSKAGGKRKGSYGEEEEEDNDNKKFNVDKIESSAVHQGGHFPVTKFVQRWFGVLGDEDFSQHRRGNLRNRGVDGAVAPTAGRGASDGVAPPTASFGLGLAPGSMLRASGFFASHDAAGLHGAGGSPAPVGGGAAGAGIFTSPLSGSVGAGSSSSSAAISTGVARGPTTTTIPTSGQHTSSTSTTTGTSGQHNKTMAPNIAPSSAPTHFLQRIAQLNNVHQTLRAKLTTFVNEVVTARFLHNSPKLILDSTELREQSRFLDTMRSRIKVLIDLQEEPPDISDEQQMDECLTLARHHYRFFRQLFRAYSLEAMVLRRKGGGGAGGTTPGEGGGGGSSSSTSGGGAPRSSLNVSGTIGGRADQTASGDQLPARTERVWGMNLESLYRLYQDCRLRSYSFMPGVVAQIFDILTRVLGIKDCLDPSTGGPMTTLLPLEGLVEFLFRVALSKFGNCLDLAILLNDVLIPHFSEGKDGGAGGQNR